MYADLNETVLVYLQVPSVGLQSMGWAAINWGRHQKEAPLDTPPHERPRWDPLARIAGRRNSQLKLPKSMLLSFEAERRYGPERRGMAAFCAAPRTDSFRGLPHAIPEGLQRPSDSPSPSAASEFAGADGALVSAAVAGAAAAIDDCMCGASGPGERSGVGERHTRTGSGASAWHTAAAKVWNAAKPGSRLLDVRAARL